MKTNQRLDAIEKHMNSSQKRPQSRKRAELETMLDRITTEGIAALKEPLRSIVAAVQKVRAVAKRQEVI